MSKNRWGAGWGVDGAETDQLWSWAKVERPIKAVLSGGETITGEIRWANSFWLALRNRDRGTILVSKGAILTIELEEKE